MLEKTLIAYGSPTLARLKTGSLFAAPCACSTLAAEIARLNEILIPRGVRLTALHGRQERTLLFLYRERELDETLHRSDVQALLSRYGYSDFSVPSALRCLSERLRAAPGFPHEIGVFLGYPLEDVIGFIVNSGRNYLCSGCWKAYGNEREARHAFARLHKCSAVYGRMFAAGYPLTRLTVRS